jgi:hypothetical protein
MLALSSLTILPSTIDLLHLFRLPMRGAMLSLAIGCDQLVSAMKRCEARKPHSDVSADEHAGRLGERQR